jgi:hypothetical protein
VNHRQTGRDLKASVLLLDIKTDKLVVYGIQMNRWIKGELDRWIER